MLLVIHANSTCHLLSQQSLSKKQPRYITLPAAWWQAFLFQRHSRCKQHHDTALYEFYVIYALYAHTSPSNYTDYRYLKNRNCFTWCMTSDRMSSINAEKQEDFWSFQFLSSILSPLMSEIWQTSRGVYTQIQIPPIPFDIKTLEDTFVHLRLTIQRQYFKISCQKVNN